jgi:hypothetical protein
LIVLLANNFDVKWVMSQVGHGDSKMTMDVYAQLEQRVKREHGASFDRLVSEAPEVPGGAQAAAEAETATGLPPRDPDSNWGHHDFQLTPIPRSETGIASDFSCPSTTPRAIHLQGFLGGFGPGGGAQDQFNRGITLSTMHYEHRFDFGSSPLLPCPRRDRRDCRQLWSAVSAPES